MLDSLIRYRFALPFAGFLALAVAAPARAADIVSIGILADGTYSLARGVSSGGVVAGDADSPSGAEAVRWTGGTMTGLGYLVNGNYSSAYGISADGSKIAGTADTNFGADTRAFVNDGTFTTIAPLPGGTYTFGYGISADGAFVVGESDSTSGSQAFRWSSGGGIEGLGVLSGESSSTAFAASADGSVIVGGSGAYAFRWESGSMTSLGVLSGGSMSGAYGVSADGSVVAGYADNSNGDSRAFRWESGVMTDLGVIGGSASSVSKAVSPDGYIVVGLSDSDAFLWRSDLGMLNLLDVLNSEGVAGAGDWTSLFEATSIAGNAVDGYTIAGNGYVGTDLRGFVISGLFAVPEPSTYAMAISAMGAFMFSVRCRSRRKGE